MSIEEVIKFIEERKSKAETGLEIFKKDTLIYSSGFKDGEIFAYKVILAFINKEEIGEKT